MAEVAETSKVTKIFKDLVEKNIAVPVAAMNTLTSVIRESDATTWMELEQELRSAIESLKKNCS
jgi:translation initiation factor 2B subunit (eIF-2B alpha/beta/delta family)